MVRMVSKMANISERLEKIDKIILKMENDIKILKKKKKKKTRNTNEQGKRNVIVIIVHGIPYKQNETKRGNSSHG